MIQIYNSCRNVRPNLKLFTKCYRCRQISLENQVRFSDNNNDKNVPDEKPNGSETDPKSSKGKIEYPEEPTTCCMSGCANCVWLDYAEKLSEYYKDGGEQAIKEINEKVTDQNIKAFLLHELKMRKK